MTGRRQPGSDVVSVKVKTSLLLLIRARELADDNEFTSTKVHNISTFAGSMM